MGAVDAEGGGVGRLPIGAVENTAERGSTGLGGSAGFGAGAGVFAGAVVALGLAGAGAGVVFPLVPGPFRFGMFGS